MGSGNEDRGEVLFLFRLHRPRIPCVYVLVNKHYMLVEMKIVLLIMTSWKCVGVREWMVLLLSLSFNYSYRILWREIVKLGFRPPRVRLETLCRLDQVYILKNAEMSRRTWGEYPLCINRVSFSISFEILQDRQKSARDTGLTAPGDWVPVHSSTLLCEVWKIVILQAKLAFSLL